jgi:hypothetical protein
MSFRHRYITSDEMNKFRFHHLYSELFQESRFYMDGDEEEVTKFACKSETIRRGEITFKTAFCARGYRKLEGLYDIIFKVAVLGSDNSGLETKLRISGVSFEKATDLTKRYLEKITWEK